MAYQTKKARNVMRVIPMGQTRHALPAIRPTQPAPLAANEPTAAMEPCRLQMVKCLTVQLPGLTKSATRELEKMVPARSAVPTVSLLTVVTELLRIQMGQVRPKVVTMAKTG